MSRRAGFGAIAAVAALVACQSAQAAQNGSRIAYMSTRGGWAIHSVGIDGVGDQRLTSTTGAAAAADPDWSSDGTRIAYVCGNFEICVMNVDGTGQTKLTSLPTTWPATFTYEFDPAWSPDGTRIAFESNRDSARYDIFVASADGSSVQRIGGTTADDTGPSWSPDGSQIVFTSEATGNGDLYVMNADGSGVRKLTSKKAPESNPDWSPDGAQIAFELGGDQTDIAVVRPDGTGRRRLTKSPFEEYDPAWSPDGSSLAYTSDSSGNYDVFLRLPSGTKRLTSGLTAETEPAWQPAPTTRAMAATTAGGPPTEPTQDALAVGEFLRWDSQLYGELTGITSSSLRTVSMSATGMRKDSSRALKSLKSIHPVSVRGQRIRKRAIASFDVSHDLGRHLEAAVALVKRGKNPTAFLFLASIERLVWDDAAGKVYDITRLP